MHFKYWRPEERKMLRKTDSFEVLADLSIIILQRMHEDKGPVTQVCGPISTGGLGCHEKNLARFTLAVETAHSKGVHIFSQISVETAVARLMKQHQRVHGKSKYCTPILDILYRRIFESGIVCKTLFLPGWESSFGARWERTFVGERGIIIEDYPREWLHEAEYRRLVA